MRLSEGNPFKPVQILKHTTKNSTEQTAMRTKWFKHIAIYIVQSRAAKRGCFKRGGFPIWTRPLFLSFFVLSRFFWDFPDLLGDGPGIFPIRPFSLSRPIKSTYEEQSRKGPRHNLDLS